MAWKNNWPEARVIFEIRERQRKGLAVNFQAVFKSYPSLAIMGRRVFGSWPASLRAAGIEPKEVEQRRKISDEDVMRYIRQRHARGLSLFPAYSDKPLWNMVRAAQKHFGSWKNAVAEAGFDPSLADWRPGFTPPKHQWKKTDVIEEIHDRVRNGLPVNQSEVMRQRQILFVKAKEYFGSWDKTLAEAGLNPKTVRRWHKMGNEEIINRIKAIHHKRGQLHTLESSDIRVRNAAIKAFGSWEQAITEAGLDPRLAKWKPGVRKWKWTKESIATEVRNLQSQGKSLSSSWLTRNGYTGLVAAAKKLYGKSTWGDILRELDIDPSAHVKAKREYWTRDLIKKRILQRVREGKEITHKAMKQEDQDLIAAASKPRFYGSWRKAVEAAGIEYENLFKAHVHGYWSDERIINRIREYYAEGEDISWTNMKRIDPQLAWACANRRKGSRGIRGYAEAVRAAGLDYSSIMKDIRRAFRIGNLFENLVGEAYNVLGREVERKTTIRVSSRERLVPDFIDKETGVWIDAKTYAHSEDTHNTIERYKEYAPALEIIYLKGRAPKKSRESVTFTNVESLFHDLDNAGRHDLVERIRMLRRNIIIEEKKRLGQLGLDSFTF